MIYKNSEMRLDQIISYFNEEKINLIPPFQRGQVWPLKTRQKLITNIVQGKPIPAIFLYKQESGPRYSYNILDGKQRLESLLLFIGNQRNEISIKNLARYFFQTKHKKTANFAIDLGDDDLKSFSDLDEAVVREFREYAIPTIEITLTDDSSLPEIIDLFIDINQYGVKVSRFDIVKAIGKNPTLNSVFDLLAEKQTRKQSVYYRQKSNEFTFVLKRLKMVVSLKDPNPKVDRMWERLLEIAMFQRTKKHRTPVEILKSFISGTDDKKRITKKENDDLRRVFRFLKKSYSKYPLLEESRLATDQPHFYTMITTLVSEDLLYRYGDTDLQRRLVEFSKLLRGKKQPNGGTSRAIKKYLELSVKQTTHIGRRQDRQAKFVHILANI